jgi:hypothetical protein
LVFRDAFGNVREDIQYIICHPIFEDQGEDEFALDHDNGKNQAI